jgi:hypothetical protein
MIIRSQFLDKRETQKRSEEKGKHEKQIHLQVTGAVGGKEPEHPGNGFVRSGCAQCNRFDLAVCRAAVANNGQGD